MSNQANAYLGLGEIYRNEAKFDTALDYYRKAIDTAKQGNYLQLIATTNISIGSIYKNEYIAQNNITNAKDILDFKAKALIAFKKSLEISKQIKDSHNQAMALLLIGDTCVEIEKTDQAVEAYVQAFDLTDKKHLRSELIDGIFKAARLYFENNAVKKSFEALQRIVRFSEKTRDHYKKFRALNHIGYNHFSMKDLNESLSAYQEAMKVISLNKSALVESIRNDSKFQSYRLYISITNSLDQILESSSAEGEIELEQPNTALIQTFIYDKKAQVLHHIGWIYYLTKNYEKSIDNQTKSAAFFEKSGNHHGQARAIHSIGGVYYELGNINKSLSAFQKAKSFYTKANVELSIMQ